MKLSSGEFSLWSRPGPLVCELGFHLSPVNISTLILKCFLRSRSTRRGQYRVGGFHTAEWIFKFPTQEKKCVLRVYSCCALLFLHFVIRKSVWRSNWEHFEWHAKFFISFVFANLFISVWRERKKHSWHIFSSGVHERKKNMWRLLQ